MTTIRIKAYSRTTTEDDANKVSLFEYAGSFQASERDCKLAFKQGHEARGRDVLLDWSKSMDCFDVLFIRADTDEGVSFNEYAEV